MSIYIENLPSNKAGYASRITRKLARQLHHWFRVQETRRQLRLERWHLTMMTDEALRDIGISRASAEAEAMRTDIPAARSRFSPGCD